MEMSEYEALKDRTEKASKILSDKYELDIWIEHFNNVIKGKPCVYVRSKDSRRKPTPEEIQKASENLVLYKTKSQALDLQFANL